MVRKKERIETLEALVETHKAIGAEPDSPDVKEFKERLKMARIQLEDATWRSPESI